MNAIPCKRPRVEVVTHANARAGCYSVFCRVTGCGWSYGSGKFVACKSDAESMATSHRQHHRAAVPAIEITRGDRGFVGTCSCGWVTFDGQQTSRQSVDETLAYHQRSAHGLVAS